MISLGNQLPVKVTGVYEDLPNNSTLHGLGYIAPWDLYVTTADWITDANKRWDNNSFLTYVQLADHADLKTVEKKIVNCKQAHVDPEDKKYLTKLVLNP